MDKLLKPIDKFLNSVFFIMLIPKIQNLRLEYTANLPLV